MLTVPAHIDALGVRGAQPDFKSDRTTLGGLADVEVPIVYAAAAGASERAKLAFGAATAEWIAWRLDGAADVGDLLQFLEGLWAAVIDYRYFQEVKHAAPENGGDLDHLLFKVWQTANALARLCPRGKGKPMDCVALSVLARHVLPRPAQPALKDWLARVTTDLLPAHWPMDEEIKDAAARQGPPVPREAFDPAFAYDPARDRELLDAFLRGLDPAKNPYLRPAAEMKAAGFPGEPYRS